ncbi:MAG: hypothetical protein ACOY3P_23260 [Planctomycetota bacterium]
MGQASAYVAAVATLNSQSTREEILAAYADDASYAEDGSAAKARTFITACRLLLLKMPKRVSKGGTGGEELELDTRLIQEEKTAAERWLMANPDATGGSGSGSRYFSCEDFRT